MDDREKKRSLETRRDVALALKCFMADDLKAVQDIVTTTGSLMDFALHALGATAYLLERQSNPQSFLDLLAHDKLNDDDSELSPTAQARAFILKLLADGKPQWQVTVRALAISEGHDMKTIDNAGRQLGVLRYSDEKGIRTWRLPRPDETGTPVRPGVRRRVKAKREKPEDES